jgi:hypothetical protein
LPCPGEGQIRAAQTGTLFSVGPRGIHLRGNEMKTLLCSSPRSQSARLALRKSGKRFYVIHHPPGLGGPNLPLPRATRTGLGKGRSRGEKSAA